MQYTSIRLLPAFATASCFYCVVRFLVKGYRWRKQFKNLSGPPHHWLWGHLKIIGETEAATPFAAHPQAYATIIAKTYSIEGPIIYLDLWPVANSMLMPLDTDVAQEIAMKTDKHPDEALFMDVLAGEGNLVSTNGTLWSEWRRIMNPGFAIAHPMTLVPGIVDDCLMFCDILDEHADKYDTFRVETDVTKLAIDVIGRVVMDVSFNNQREDNELVDAFKDQVRRLPIVTYDIWRFIPNPYTTYRRWINARTMDRYIGQKLEERFATFDVSTSGDKKQRKRAGIDLALESYLQQEKGQVKPNTKGQMDSTFKKYATNQIKTFIFAGHDTTSSTIAYVYYMLKKHPACLQRIRDEHDQVLGSVDETPQNIKNRPHLVDQLEYTTVVLKEILRLFPAASSVRAGAPDLFLKDPNNDTEYPTNEFLVWISTHYLQRAEKYWGPTATRFDPSRFLPENAAQLPPSGAWRPFERGLRNCIGQDLAMLEAKITLALTVRQFDFEIAFDRLDELAGDGSIFAKDPRYRIGRQDLDGEEAYQVLIATAKPREGMPMRVKKRVVK